MLSAACSLGAQRIHLQLQGHTCVHTHVHRVTQPQDQASLPHMCACILMKDHQAHTHNFTQCSSHMSKHSHPTFVKHLPCAERWASHERSREKQIEGAALRLPRAQSGQGEQEEGRRHWAWGLSLRIQGTGPAPLSVFGNVQSQGLWCGREVQFPHPPPSVVR